MYKLKMSNIPNSIFKTDNRWKNDLLKSIDLGQVCLLIN